MSAISTRRSTTEILTAFQTALAAAVWTVALPAIADPIAAPSVDLVTAVGSTISDGHGYIYAVSYLTAQGETALSLVNNDLTTTMPQADKGVMVTFPDARPTRVLKVRVWRNKADGSNELFLLAEVNSPISFYLDTEPHAVFAGRAPVTVPPAANTTAATVTDAAFQTVKLYDVADLAAAMTEMLLSSQRICLIIPDSEVFDKTLSGALTLMLNRTLPVALLISDSVLGDRQKALHGDLAANPPTAGAFNLQEIALQVLTGQLINPAEGRGGVLCLPITNSVLNIEDTKKKMPGRACVEVDFHCTGGTLKASTKVNL